LGGSGERIRAVRTLSRPNTGISQSQYRGAREGLAVASPSPTMTSPTMIAATMAPIRQCRNIVRPVLAQAPAAPPVRFRRAPRTDRHRPAGQRRCWRVVVAPDGKTGDRTSLYADGR